MSKNPGKGRHVSARVHLSRERSSKSPASVRVCKRRGDRVHSSFASFTSRTSGYVRARIHIRTYGTYVCTVLAQLCEPRARANNWNDGGVVRRLLGQKCTRRARTAALEVTDRCACTHLRYPISAPAARTRTPYPGCDPPLLSAPYREMCARRLFSVFRDRS